MMRTVARLAAIVLLAGTAVPLSAQSSTNWLGFGPQPQTPARPGNPVAAATPPAPTVVSGIDTVMIGGPGAVIGVATVNGASGVNNQQVNAGIIASGTTALAMGSILQITHGLAQAGGQPARAAVAAGAFAGSNGWIAVNGAAGADNQQANLAIMALGGEAVIVSDTTLASSRASQEPMGENGATADVPSRSVAVGGGAFRDSSGIVQLSLIGGDRNTSANSFALLVAGSAGN